MLPVPRTPAKTRPLVPTVYIETYGCQMNVADSDLVLGQFGLAGYRRTEDAAEADVILVNTCAVREPSPPMSWIRPASPLTLSSSSGICAIWPTGWITRISMSSRLLMRSSRPRKTRRAISTMK